jgi:hypothetical protein
VTSSELGDFAGLYGAQAMVLDAAYSPAVVDERLAREGMS